MVLLQFLHLVPLFMDFLIIALTLSLSDTLSCSSIFVSLSRLGILLFSDQNKLPCLIVSSNAYLESIHRRVIDGTLPNQYEIITMPNSDNEDFDISTDLEITDFKFNQKYFLEENKSYTIK